MANRVYWAVQAVGIAPQSSVSFTTVHGAQSVGITTTFNLEQVFELGQLAIYENIENIPDIEMTMEKVLDGNPLIYHLCTRGYTTGSLAGRSTKRPNVALSVYDDTQDASSGVPVAGVYMSGMYLSSVTYTFPTDGNCTEAVTLVGNNKIWAATGGDALFKPDTFLTQDTPPHITAMSGGVQRRENVVFTADQMALCAVSERTILPSGDSGIPGITGAGYNEKTSDVFGAHISQITTSVDLGREAINELGRKGPYFRFVNWPVEVSTDIEVITTTGDKISATENGVIGSTGSNLEDQTIKIVCADGTVINTGNSNKLASVTYGGGDTGGGQATVTYTYTTFNEFLVTHPADPVT